MDTSSEYTFPIFVSSTDYNLKDLRAELARFLSELGYRPILSSAEGFPDSSPKLEPWESCLPVLDKSFVMVLVIDGRYGTELRWNNYKELLEERKVSPTHGEYAYAHRNRKRMLVFIRKEVMVHYQSYRTCLEKTKGDKAAAEKILSPTLPDYVDFKTLDFVNEVKTTKPIPWIKEFEDITSIKKEIQKKMLNELAELFLIKNMHFETVIDSFNKVMDSLTTEEQKKVFHKLNATKELTEAVDKLDAYKKELDETKTALEDTKKLKSTDKDKYEKRLKTLNEKISALEKETLESSSSQFYIKDGNVKFGNPNFISANAFAIPASGVVLGGTAIPLTTSGSVFGGTTIPLTTSGSVFGGTTIPLTTSGSVFDGTAVPLTAGSLGTSAIYLGKTCDNCGKNEHDPFRVATASVYGNQFRTCPSCNRYLCNDCYPYNNTLTTGAISLNGNDKCTRCKKEGK